MSRRITRRKKVVSLVMGAALLCLGAYVSASYILSPAVQDSGGGHAESQDYQLDASIGGPVIAPADSGGTATSANYKLEVNSMGLLEGPAKAPSTGGGGGGCADVGGGASPIALFLPLGLLAFLLRRCGTART